MDTRELVVNHNEEAAIEREIISCTLHEFYPKPACKIIAFI